MSILRSSIVLTLLATLLLAGCGDGGGAPATGPSSDQVNRMTALWAKAAPDGQQLSAEETAEMEKLFALLLPAVPGSGETKGLAWTLSMEEQAPALSGMHIMLGKPDPKDARKQTQTRLDIVLTPGFDHVTPWKPDLSPSEVMQFRVGNVSVMITSFNLSAKTVDDLVKKFRFDLIGKF